MRKRVDTSRRQPRHGPRQRLGHLTACKNDPDHAGRREKNLIDITSQQLRSASANALGGFQSGTPGDRVGAACVDDNAFHATAGFLQRQFREHDRRGQKSILREDGRSVCASFRNDEAEVRALLADTRANAGGYEPFRKFQPTLPAIFVAASVTLAGAVPPTAFFLARMPSSVTPYSFASFSMDANCCPTFSCASRKGTPLTAIASAP